MCVCVCVCVVLYVLQILTVAVMAIILTAPLGALATSLLGPVLLKKAEAELEDHKPVADESTRESVYNGGTNAVCSLPMYMWVSKLSFWCTDSF